jgi:hypothetical protein
MACAAVAININSEAPGDDLQILDASVPGILPHSGKDLLGIGH